MRITFALLFMLNAVVLADEPNKKDAAKEELKKLEGVWEGFVVDGKGEKDDRGPVHLRITIAGDKMTAVDLAKDGKDMGSGTFKIDLSISPKGMDATGVVLPGKKDRKFMGIYELDGDTLKWCVDNRRAERPTELKTISGNYLMILKRKK